MSSLIVFVFDNEGEVRAFEDELINWQNQGLDRVDDAVVVVRKQDGGVHAEQASRLVGMGSLGGVFWGMLIGALFWSKWWGLSIGGVFGDIGVDEEYVRDVGNAIGKGDSAIFLLVNEVLAGQVIKIGESYNTQVYPLEISDENKSRLMAAFGAAGF